MRRFHRLRARRAYACDVCGTHIYPTAGTFLKSSNLGLATWFNAIRLMLEPPKEMPAMRLAAELSVSYRTALRIREKLAGAAVAMGHDARLLRELQSFVSSPSGAVAKPRPPAASATVDKIRAAACRAFLSRGLAATRVADVAREAGVSAASIHYHFGSKERVLLAALEWSTEQNVNRLRQASRETRDPLATLLATLHMALPGGGMPHDDGPLWLEAYVNVRHRPELLDACESASAVWTDFLVDLIDEGAERGVFHPVAPAREIALGLTAILDGLGFKGIAGFRHLDPALVKTILHRFTAQQLGIPPASIGVTC